MLEHSAKDTSLFKPIEDLAVLGSNAKAVDVLDEIDKFFDKPEPYPLSKEEFSKLVGLLTTLPKTDLNETVIKAIRFNALRSAFTLYKDENEESSNFCLTIAKIANNIDPDGAAKKIDANINPCTSYVTICYDLFQIAIKNHSEAGKTIDDALLGKYLLSKGHTKENCEKLVSQCLIGALLAKKGDKIKWFELAKKLELAPKDEESEISDDVTIDSITDLSDSKEPAETAAALTPAFSVFKVDQKQTAAALAPALLGVTADQSQTAAALIATMRRDISAGKPFGNAEVNLISDVLAKVMFEKEDLEKLFLTALTGIGINQNYRDVAILALEKKVALTKLIVDAPNKGEVYDLHKVLNHREDLDIEKIRNTNQYSPRYIPATFPMDGDSLVATIYAFHKDGNRISGYAIAPIIEISDISEEHLRKIADIATLAILEIPRDIPSLDFNNWVHVRQTATNKLAA